MGGGEAVKRALQVAASVGGDKYAVGIYSYRHRFSVDKPCGTDDCVVAIPRPHVSIRRDTYERRAFVIGDRTSIAT